MILNQRETTVAYRCPHCGSGVVSMVGAFLLSADMMKLKCTCGESEMSIVYTPDKKIRLTVPCFICPKPHHFLLSSSMFFERELFALPCPVSGLNIGFTGSGEQVRAALEESDRELMALLEEADAENFSSLRDEDQQEQLTDPQVLDIVIFVINDLKAEGAIHCHCEDGCGDYTVSVEEDHVLVFCEKCGASVCVPTHSVADATAFLHCENLKLN